LFELPGVAKFSPENAGKEPANMATKSTCVEMPVMILTARPGFIFFFSHVFLVEIVDKKVSAERRLLHACLILRRQFYAGNLFSSFALSLFRVGRKVGNKLIEKID
jgi:hypothetical protein